MLSRALLWSLGVTALAAVVAYAVPESYGATAVALCFAGATYVLVLRGSSRTIEHYGCALGGLLLPERLEPRRLLTQALSAVGWCALAVAIFFPPYWVGFVQYWRPTQAFSWPAGPPLDAWLGHLFAVAVPEELFYRGYAQTALDDAWSRHGGPSAWVFGARVGPGLLLSSLIFALGHVATQPALERSLVFFPSLLFGWMRARTGGIGASVLFHASCNLFAAYLADGYFGP